VFSLVANVKYLRLLAIIKHKFNTVTEFAYILKNFHEANGEKVEIINTEYRFV